MQSVLIVFFGGGLGAVLRHLVNVGCARACGTSFPWGTMTVNVVGSFLMGILAAWLSLKAGEERAEPLRLLLATGILGGFTTFSAYSLDVVLLWERGAVAAAALHAAGSVVLSLMALIAGLAVVRALT